MGNISFDELEVLVQSFLIGASTGVFLGFVVWCIRLIVIVFKKFF